MEGCRYGRWTGLWCTPEEAAQRMLHVTPTGEVPVTTTGVSEGDILVDAEHRNCIFEVLLYDHVRDLVFLTEV